MYVRHFFITIQKKEQIILHEVHPNAPFEVNATVLNHSRCYKYYIRGYKNDANGSMEAILVHIMFFLSPNSSTFITLNLLDSFSLYSIFS